MGEQSEWAVHLLRVELASAHAQPSVRAGAPPDRIADGMLPALLYVRGVAVLDDVLSTTVRAKDLDRRISAAQEGGLVDGNVAEALHQIRRRRNEVAHQVEPAPVTWDELRAASATIGHALGRLGHVVPSWRLSARTTRHSPIGSSDPAVIAEIPWVTEVFDESTDTTLLSYSWTTRLRRREPT